MHHTFHEKQVLAHLLLTRLGSNGGNELTQGPCSLPSEPEIMSPRPASLLTPPTCLQPQIPSSQRQTAENPQVYLGSPFESDYQSKINSIGKTNTKFLNKFVLRLLYQNTQFAMKKLEEI
ncbi:hypothetical protein J6590_075131 [Homalodisca vitripennis]|nr:hypothetical protein J6590_075131 [Homalodisca vitripennis]